MTRPHGSDVISGDAGVPVPAPQRADVSDRSATVVLFAVVPSTGETYV